MSIHQHTADENERGMSLHVITHRWHATEIALVPACSFGDAVEFAVGQSLRLYYAELAGRDLSGRVLRGADFRGVDLTRASLVGADLQAADLRTACLQQADLRGVALEGADLRQADLRQADLRDANLENTRLVGADLRGTLLHGAKLSGAILDWRWSTIPLELLRQHHQAAGIGSPVIAEMAFEEDARPFAWLKLLVRQGARADWILRVLSPHLRPDDNAPELLRRLVADLPGKADEALSPTAFARGHQLATDLEPLPEEPPSTPMLWSRRPADYLAMNVLESP